MSKDKKNGNGEKKAPKMTTARVEKLKAELAAMDPDQIRMGLNFLITMGRPLAKYTANKWDDTAVNFLEIVAEPGMIERVMEAWEVET